MKQRTLGKNLTVSAVGLGCMGLSHAYGAATEKTEAIRILRQAVDMGYNFFDTAEVYGDDKDPHINERIVGEALRSYGDKVIIATKFGVRHDRTSPVTPYSVIPDARPEVIRRSVEGSLKRLGVECIDLYYQHRIDPKVPPEEVTALDDALERIPMSGVFGGAKNPGALVLQGLRMLLQTKRFTASCVSYIVLCHAAR